MMTKTARRLSWLIYSSILTKDWFGKKQFIVFSFRAVVSPKEARAPGLSGGTQVANDNRSVEERPPKARESRRRQRLVGWGLGGISPPQPTRGSGESRELPQLVRGEAPAVLACIFGSQNSLAHRRMRFLPSVMRKINIFVNDC